MSWLEDFKYRVRTPKQMQRLDDNTYYGGNLGGVTITKKRKKPYWVSPRGVGNMTVMPGDPEMVFFAPIAAGAAVAASPAISSAIGSAVSGINTTGDALAATAAGQRLTSGLNFVGNAIGKSKAWPWIDTGLTSIFGAQGIDKVASRDIHNVGDVVETGLDLLPLAQLARPIVNTASRVGSVIENNLPAIQKALKLNPLPSYKYEDIIKSDFYKRLVSEYGEAEANYIAKEISSPEGRNFIIGNSPRTAYKTGKKHLTQMNLIRDLEDSGAILGGSPELARFGTVYREGPLHDIDVFAPGSMEEKVSPLFTNPDLKLTPLYKQQNNPFAATGMVPKSRKITIGSPSKGYINIPHMRDGEVVDMFIRPDFPTTDEQAVNLILDAKRQFGRPKDISDLLTFKPYSADNPMINLTTGEGQWNPTLFDQGIFTSEGYPFIQSVEIYPGSGVRVPAMMNYKGQIKGLVDNTSTPSGLLSNEHLIARGTPEITAENAARMTPAQWTAAQDAAIARGDMAEAQRLRDLHFQVSAPNSVTHEVFHHGNTKPMDWYIFDPKRVGITDEGYSGAGYYFAPTKPASQYVKEHLPHTLGPHGEQNAGLSGGKYHRYVYLNGKTKYKPLREHDWTTHTDLPFVDNRPVEVVVGDNKQIKLADAVTYDDNGVRIPLGERDNFKLNDIRYNWIAPFVGLGTLGTLLNKQ